MTELSRPRAGRRDIERFLRVDHAGERAAQQIYRGQLAILWNHATGPQIQHMMDQEVEHLEAFEALLNERQVRPSLLDPVWGAAGFALGAVTAAMGPKAAMACTIAVEEVIGEHYADQADRLGDEEAPLRSTIAKFHDDELEHRDIAVDHRGREAMFYAALKAVIQQGCRTAIRIAERVCYSAFPEVWSARPQAGDLVGRGSGWPEVWLAGGLVGLELGVPVEIITPAFMQIVRREPATVLLKLPDIRSRRL